MRNLFKKSLAIVVALALCLTALVGAVTVNAETKTGTITADVTVGDATVDVVFTITTDGLNEAIFSYAYDEGLGVPTTIESVNKDLEVVTAETGNLFELRDTSDNGLTDVAEGKVKFTFNKPADGTYNVTLSVHSAGASGTDEILIDIAPCTATIEIAPAHEHNYSAEWTHDETNHWHICLNDGCDGTLADKAAHTYGEPVITYTDCTSAGNAKYTCTVCGYSYQQATDPKGHTPVSADNAVPATCGAAGKESDTVCKDCGAVLEEGAVIPATGHTELADSATLKTVTETHFVYDCVCSVCHETYAKQVEIGTPLASLARPGCTILPENDISLLFRIDQSLVEGYSDLTLITYKENFVTGSTTPEAEPTPNYITTYKSYYDTATKKDRYEFTFSNIGAYEIASTITADLYGKDSTGKMIKIGYREEYSVRTYAMNQIGRSTNTAALKKVLVDLLKYGSAAQLHANYNTGDLADSLLTTEQLALGTQTYPASKTDCNALDSSVTTAIKLDESTLAGSVRIGSTLNPGSKIELVFTLPDSKNNAYLENFYCKFDYYHVVDNGSGQNVIEQTSTIAAYDGYIQNTNPAFRFAEAPVSLIDYPVTATIYYGNPDDGGVQVAKRTYSVETYIANHINDNHPTLPNVLKMMFALGESIATYSGVGDGYIA